MLRARDPWIEFNIYLAHGKVALYSVVCSIRGAFKPN
jgi:hypothetical protein